MVNSFTDMVGQAEFFCSRRMRPRGGGHNVRFGFILALVRACAIPIAPMIIVLFVAGDLRQDFRTKLAA